MTDETEEPRPHQSQAAQTRTTTVLSFIKTNKELLAVAGSSATALFGAIAWAFAYFATEEELTRLECTMGSNLLLQVLPAEIGLDTLKLEQRNVELERIRSASTGGDQTLITLKRLEDEIQTLQAERKKYNDTYADILARVGSAACLHKKEEKSQ